MCRDFLPSDGNEWAANLVLMVLFQLDRTGAGKMELERVEAEQEMTWESMTTSEKVGEWATRHMWSLIFGSWAGTLAVAGAIISKDKWVITGQLCWMECELLMGMVDFEDFRRLHKRLYKFGCGLRGWRLGWSSSAVFWHNQDEPRLLSGYVGPG
jgi:hypothetical protein